MMVDIATRVASPSCLHKSLRNPKEFFHPVSSNHSLSRSLKLSLLTFPPSPSSLPTILLSSRSSLLFHPFLACSVQQRTASHAPRAQSGIQIFSTEKLRLAHSFFLLFFFFRGRSFSMRKLRWEVRARGESNFNENREWAMLAGSDAANPCHRFQQEERGACDNVRMSSIVPLGIHFQA